MPLIDVDVSVHHSDDVTFLMDTGQFLDAIGPVDRELEGGLNDALDAHIDAHAYYSSTSWYSVACGCDTRTVLRTALASAARIGLDDLVADYSFATCNWENVLSQDFGGTLWSTRDGRRLLTIESEDYGVMKAFVGVRSVDCEEPDYVIAHCSSHVHIGCTCCAFTIHTAHERVDWAALTHLPTRSLRCPRCAHPMRAEVWI